MIKFYYGNLKDKTITSALNYSAQYPLANLNVLNRDYYSYLDDNDTEIGASDYTFELFKIDIGTASKPTPFIIDTTALTFQFDTTAHNIDNYTLALYYSVDDITYNLAGMIYEESDIAALTYTHILDGINEQALSVAVNARYYKLIAYLELADTDTLDWDIDGIIHNVYLGDVCELPCPELARPVTLTHATDISTAFGGGRNGRANTAQREGWEMTFYLDETQKDALRAFDVVNKGGAVPCYFEEESIIDPTFVRVIGNIRYTPVAYQLYETTLNIEEEL